ncbi:MAG: T9SS type A sorting domain-containing protein [Crocinitomicaceae bacterium]|nr:T9SS type A sorting domain-containing protein [Crocinitomicaceae bacterium]
MKTFSIIAFLLTTFVGFSQTLPEDFEMSITTSDFIDFDGGVATVLANPQSSGINTSATVGEIVRNGGQVWAGSKYILASNIDFTTNSIITMKVYTAAPIGTVVKFKLEDGVGGSTEVDATTTTTGAWEELSWDFVGTPTSYNTIALMFDFGNLGNGSATSTFLFDDIAQVSPTLSQIDLPITFESSTVDYTMTDFGGNVTTLVVDPTNPANMVMQADKGAAAQLWAGSTMSTPSGLASAIPFTATATTMTVRVWSPTAMTPIRLKVEDATNAAISCETEVMTTVASAWETLTFDFATPVGGTPALDILNTYDMASIFFNFGTDGATAGAQTYYFDDVNFGTPTGPLSQIDLPVTFEDPTVDYTMTDFGDNMSTMVTDPTNPLNTVQEVIKPVTAAAWAGTTISTPSGFTSIIPLTMTNSTMTVKVWSPTSGTPIRLKVEDATDPTHTCETETNTTVAGAWETLTFNFANEAPGTQTLNFGITNGWVFDMASIFFNFGTDGATAGAQTYYFDDVYFGAPATSLSQIDLPITFEDPTVDYTMTDFGGNTATLIVDPTDPTNNVMEALKDASAQLWAGTTMSTPAGLASAIPFSATETQMTVRVWSPTAGTPIRLKVEDATNPTISCETETSTTVASGWETLTFDFSNEVAGTAALDILNTYDMASIFFNFGTDGATAGAQTYYFDDVMFGQPPVSLSQIDLPVTFEDPTVDYTMTDFGGNTATMVVDPTDPTNTVMEVLKDASAQLWAGTTVSTPAGLASAIPFTATETEMTVRVWSPTAGTPIRLKVEDATNPTISCETETNTTVASGWETLTFDLSNEVMGTAALDILNTYDMVSIFFNFGTDGATAGAQTYYFDDVMFGQPATPLNQIDLPVTFEDPLVDYTMTDFGGNVSTMITDPTDPTNTVMETLKDASAQTWAGTTISTPAGLATAIPFTATETQMTVRVWSPTAGTPIRLKVEDATNNTITCETEVVTTVASDWETLVFDFAAPVAGTPALDILNTYDMASIFFNFGTDGATAGAQTYYFDDVMFGAPVNPLDQIDMPVTFEDANVDYTMTDFGNNIATMVTDPTNPTNTVMEVVKPITAEVWAGTSIGTPAGFATDIAFSATETFISVRVWSPTAGTPIRLKVENSADNTQTCETELTTSVAGDWETLIFDFSNEVAGTATLSDGLLMGWTYDLASIFFNFGTDGATAGEQTYYFDDVMFGDPFAGINDLEIAGLSVYPNPSSDQWTILSELTDIDNVVVYDLQGSIVLETSVEANTVAIDANAFEAGVYLAYVSTSNGTSIIRMVKK